MLYDVSVLLPLHSPQILRWELVRGNARVMAHIQDQITSEELLFLGFCYFHKYTGCLKCLELPFYHLSG